MRLAVRAVACVLLSVVALACDVYVLGVESVQPCDRQVTVIVNTSTPAPAFSWSPACSVQQLTVYQSPPAQSVAWRITKEGGINPGVRYGRVPQGARQVTPPQPLDRGEGASVELVSKDSTGTARLVGGTGFRP